MMGLPGFLGCEGCVLIPRRTENFLVHREVVSFAHMGDPEGAVSSCAW